MSYSDFTLQKIVKDFQLVLQERTDLFVQVAEVTLSDSLATNLKENVPLALAINTEKARSALIIAVVLVELRKLLHYRISLLSPIGRVKTPAFTVFPGCPDDDPARLQLGQSL